MTTHPPLTVSRQRNMIIGSVLVAAAATAAAALMALHGGRLGAMEHADIRSREVAALSPDGVPPAAAP